MLAIHVLLVAVIETRTENDISFNFGGADKKGQSLMWLWLSCRATEGSVLEEFLCFGVVAALILARLQGH